MRGGEGGEVGLLLQTNTTRPHKVESSGSVVERGRVERPGFAAVLGFVRSQSCGWTLRAATMPPPYAHAPTLPPSPAYRAFSATSRAPGAAAAASLYCGSSMCVWR